MSERSVSLDSLAAYGKGRMENTEAFLDKVLFEDESKASVFLKDLISASGLKGAWSEISSRIRQIQTSHDKLMSLASREALYRDFVSRPEYKTSTNEHESLLSKHSNSIGTLEEKVEDNTTSLKSVTDFLNETSALLKSEVAFVKPRLEDTREWLERVEERESANSTSVTKALADLVEDVSRRDKALRKEISRLENRLNDEMSKREVIEAELEKQKHFLASEGLRTHILTTCQESLTLYVAKTEMMEEVNRVTFELVEPLKVDLRRQIQDLQITTSQLGQKDRSIEKHIEDVESRLREADEEFDERLVGLSAEVQLRATLELVSTLEAQVKDRLREVFEREEDLRRSTTHKVQEVVTRLSEFQPILEDHEHALQHQAEELLNRSTKYDIALCRELIEKCAIKSKVETELKAMRQTLNWQTSKMESIGQSSGFGGGGSIAGFSQNFRATSVIGSQIGSGGGFRGRAMSVAMSGAEISTPRSSQSFQAPQPSASFLRQTSQFSEKSMQEDNSPRRRSRVSTLVDKEAIAAIAESVIADKEKRTSEDASLEEDGTDEVELGRSISQRILEVDLPETGDGGGSEEGGLDTNMLMQFQMQQDQEFMLQQVQQMIQASGGGGDSVLRDQIQCIAQALLCLGRALLRPIQSSRPNTSQGLPSPRLEGLTGLSREARWDYCSELLHHMSSILSWVTNRAIPSDWDPAHLTTAALRSLPAPGAYAGTLGGDTIRPAREASPPSRGVPVDPRTSLRRGRPRPKVVVPEAVSLCSGKAFAATEKPPNWQKILSSKVTKPNLLVTGSVRSPQNSRDSDVKQQKSITPFSVTPDYASQARASSADEELREALARSLPESTVNTPRRLGALRIPSGNGINVSINSELPNFGELDQKLAGFVLPSLTKTLKKTNSESALSAQDPDEDASPTEAVKQQ